MITLASLEIFNKPTGAHSHKRSGTRKAGKARKRWPVTMATGHGQAMGRVHFRWVHFNAGAPRPASQLAGAGFKSVHGPGWS